MTTETDAKREALEGIRGALLHWQATGIAKPAMEVYADLDGDGKLDYYGLDLDEKLLIITDIETGGWTNVSISTGEEGF